MQAFSSLVIAFASINVGVAYTDAQPCEATKQVKLAAPLQRYIDNEPNVMRGVYLLWGNAWHNSRHFESDQAWTDSDAIKYFFRRYFGVGLEGWAVNVKSRSVGVFIDSSTEELGIGVGHESRVTGAVLDNLTLCYPIPCMRLLPYVVGGESAIFGGGERVRFVTAAELVKAEEAKGEIEGIHQIDSKVGCPDIAFVTAFSRGVAAGTDNAVEVICNRTNFGFQATGEIP
jgi:hypothetical protein